MSLLERLQCYGEVLVHEPMSRHTTYRIGGKVDYYIYPHTEIALVQILKMLKVENVPYYVLGRGSNLLFHDDDFHGAIINLDKTLNNYYFEPDGTLVAQAGCSIINLAIEALKRSFTGLEFASGIPGSLGGGLFMNAGAYQSDLAGIVESVCVIQDENLIWLPKSSLDYRYRHSLFQNHRDLTIVAARLKLEKADQEQIRQLMRSRHERRVSSQPLDKPCAGSVFRNPDERPAWKIIDDLGLRGLQIGGARISEKHSNFIVNEGGAKAEDVHALISRIQKSAKEKYAIDLITEVEYLNWDEKKKKV